MEQFEGERAMLARYSLHMALLEKVKELGSAHLEALEELVLYRDNKWVCPISCVCTAAVRLTYIAPPPGRKQSCF